MAGAKVDVAGVCLMVWDSLAVGKGDTFTREYRPPRLLMSQKKCIGTHMSQKECIIHSHCQCMRAVSQALLLGMHAHAPAHVCTNASVERVMKQGFWSVQFRQHRSGPCEHEYVQTTDKIFSSACRMVKQMVGRQLGADQNQILLQNLN